MNKLDKFDVNLGIFFDKHLLRMNDEKLLETLLIMYTEPKPQVLPYIFSKFKKHKCEKCGIEIKGNKKWITLIQNAKKRGN